MSLIHHAICQQTCMESILNLFNEKQLSSKLEARKSLKSIWACMFWLWNKFWLSVWCKDIFFETRRDDKFPQGQTKSMRAHARLKHAQLLSWLSVSECVGGFFLDCVGAGTPQGFSIATVCACVCFDVFPRMSLLTPHKRPIIGSAGEHFKSVMFCILHYVSASEGACMWVWNPSTPVLIS